MKAPASISVFTSLVLATFAFTDTVRSATNEPVSSSGLPIRTGVVAVPIEANRPAQLRSAAPSLSRCSAEIVQLTQAGMDEGVVIAFISSSGFFQLSADHIVYLNDLGVSSQVIQAMLAHDRKSFGLPAQMTNAANASASVREETVKATLVEKSTTPDLVPTTVASEQGGLTAAIAQTARPEVGMSKQDSQAIGKSSRPQAAPAKKKVFYPIREPYPVELTTPIVFLDAPTF